VDRVLGARQEITYLDFVELKYCAYIFKETLRLWPPIPVLTCIIGEEMIVNGYVLSKNTHLMSSTYMNARLEKFFPNPLEFKPERFMKDETIGVQVNLLT
jgi:cytochrome P450